VSCLGVVSFGEIAETDADFALDLSLHLIHHVGGRGQPSKKRKIQKRDTGRHWKRLERG
jgi:hypothetical protein